MILIVKNYKTKIIFRIFLIEIRNNRCNYFLIYIFEHVLFKCTYVIYDMIFIYVS